ncbi:hypothetical protein NP493_383g04028 [Ridgeia piscesae]|uniref:SURP motif domain-containing protein n=1 Tax=Ridgeia piscesae TaxID=27915 RepID=A0AAD9L1Z2_RIDPI|nr:hypothetical protein NP493_383g04028 [Ridgeia piscesae]
MAARKRPILKKRTAQEQKEDLESLFVFGYQCKVFKDDEKADYIERGKHLIPWMGDNSLMIDRYDGRGYLHDLRPYDADLNCHKNTELTGEELAVEAACEEERYLELNTDYMERVLYEEEELKRLHEALGEDSYGAVGFSYDQGVGQQNDQENSDSEKDEEFIPPSDFHVPDGIKLPDTVKMNAIVVRTAKCISEHGTQMEIIIKTKQADNPQFHFLEYDSELYPYYRHLVQVIKSGRYNPSSMLKPRRSRQESVTEEDEHYLHPSLVKTSSSSNLSTQDILSIISHRLPVSQISDTPYARLVEKMKQSGCRSPLNTQPRICHLCWVRRSRPAPVADVMPALEPPPRPPFEVIADTEPPKNHGHLPPVPGVEPVILPPRSQPPPQTTHPPQEQDTEDDERPQIEPPPPDLQSIIDKMAMYVAKNGPEFEIVVKSKKDKRFDFLHSWHKHFPYYHHKKTLHLQELKGTGSSSSGDDDDSNSNDRGQLKSISFSIRNKETDSSVSLSGRAALLGYDSSSDDDSGEKDEDGDIDNASEGTVVIPENVTATKERTPPSTEEQEKRLVEQKLRDKLAAAARDKLAHAAKEKQLQAERKRKAAMFISMLKGGAAAAQPNTEVQPPGSTLPASASAPTMSFEGNSSSTRNDAPPTGTPPNYRRSPDLYSRFPRRSRSPINHHRSRHKRHWSPTKRRSRSPVKRARGKTPPSAYSVVRRSLSKSPRRRQKSRSRSPHRTRRPRPPSPSLDKLSLSACKSKSKGKKRSRSRSESKRRSRSKSKSISRRRSRSKSKGRSVSKAKEPSLSRASPSRMKSQKHRSRSRSQSKLKRTRKSPSRSKKHKSLVSRSPAKRRKSHSRSPSRHKLKKHSHSKSKKKSPKHKSKSRTKKSSSKSKRSSRSRSRSKKRSSSPVLSPKRAASKQPSRSRSHSVDDALDSKVESKRSPSVSKSPSVDKELRSKDTNQNVTKYVHCIYVTNTWRYRIKIGQMKVFLFKVCILFNQFENYLNLYFKMYVKH